MAAHREVTRSAEQRFDAAAVDVSRKVENRFDDYIAVLTGLRARFSTSAAVTHDEFRDYVAGLNLASNYPGFQVVNYAPYVAAADKHRFKLLPKRWLVERTPSTALRAAASAGSPSSAAFPKTMSIAPKTAKP